MIHPLKLRRLQKGMTQHDLSLLSGVPQVRISCAERGYPALNQKEAIAKVLGYTPKKFSLRDGQEGRY